MPKIRTSKTKYPEGWDIISPTIEEFAKKMKDGTTDSFLPFIFSAENEPHEGKRKAESSWTIFRIHHQRSRYIFDLYYRKKEISKELYDFCLREGYADANLIAKWKKVHRVIHSDLFFQSGYEKLCCLRCVQTRDHNFSTACICRVPKKNIENSKVIECIHCGCRGCASCD